MAVISEVSATLKEPWDGGSTVNGKGFFESLVLKKYKVKACAKWMSNDDTDRYLCDSCYTSNMQVSRRTETHSSEQLDESQYCKLSWAGFYWNWFLQPRFSYIETKGAQWHALCMQNLGLPHQFYCRKQKVIKSEILTRLLRPNGLGYCRKVAHRHIMNTRYSVHSKQDFQWHGFSAWPPRYEIPQVFQVVGLFYFSKCYLTKLHKFCVVTLKKHLSTVKKLCLLQCKLMRKIFITPGRLL